MPLGDHGLEPAFSKLTEMVNGEPRIVSDLPLIERVEDIGSDVAPQLIMDALHDLLRVYRYLQTDRRILLEEFRLVDLAEKWSEWAAAASAI